jgi:hypothetical protein
MKKKYYEYNKEAIPKIKRYQTQLKEERGEIIDIKQKRQHNKIKTEPQQRKIYDTNKGQAKKLQVKLLVLLVNDLEYSRSARQ